MYEQKNKLKHNNYQYEGESDILEECSICHEEMTMIEDILVSVQKDTYLCKHCACKHNIKTIPCMELE